MSSAASTKEPLSQDALFSSSEDLALPHYSRNTLSEVNLPKLILLSHGHSPPLHPQPRLRFEVRNLPNPPKSIRDAHDGTSKRLQEWMLADPKFVRRRDAIKSEIELALTEILATNEKTEVLMLDDSSNETKEDSDEPEILESRLSGDEDQMESSSDGIIKPSVYHEGSTAKPMYSRDRIEFRVGIYCAMGKHRSVAMVEELAKLPWPGWEVEVEHRDVSKKRGTGKKSETQRNRGTRGKRMNFIEVSE